MLTRMDKPFVFFSSLVYEPCPLSVTIDRDTWYRWNKSTDFPNLNDFYACAYLFTNIDPPKMAITFRGTKRYHPWNYFDDILAALGKVPLAWMSQAQPFLEGTLDQILRAYPTIQITFTGHSLGALHAELSAAYWKKPAVSVESLGSLQSMHTLLNDGVITPDNIDYAKNNVVSYNAGHNAITYIQDHIGIVCQVYPSHDFTDPICSEKITTNYYFFTYTTQQHDVSHILDQFTSQNKPEVYRVIPGSEWPSLSFMEGFYAWLNFNNQPYYWSQMIEASHPKCNPEMSFEQYKQHYFLVLYFNNNPYEQTGHEIYALGKPGQSTIVWGTTSGKDHLIFAENNAFNVVAFGFNKYSLNMVINSIYILQQDDDTKRESQIYLTNYNCYLGGLAINNGLQLSPACKSFLDPAFARINDTLHPGNFDIRVGPIRVTNSPLGQFNIIPATRSNFIYKDILPPRKTDTLSTAVAITSTPYVNIYFTWVRDLPQLYRYDMNGNFIDKQTISYPTHCNTFSFNFLAAYEQNNNMNVWSICNVNSGSYASFVNLNENPYLRCDMSFRCFRAPNFNVYTNCTDNPNQCPLEYEIMLPNMTFTAKSGAKIMLKNSQSPNLYSTMAILDSQNVNLFSGDFPLRDPVNCYRLFYPGEISADENMRFMLTNCIRNHDELQLFTIETQALQYVRRLTAHELVANSTIPQVQQLSATIISEPLQANEKYALTLHDARINNPSEIDLNKLTQVIYQGAWQGALRGSAQVVEDCLQNLSYSANAAYYAKQLTYYGCYFTTSFVNQYNNSLAFNSDTAEEFSTTIALYNAAVDTGFLFTANKTLEKASDLVHWLGDKLTENGWKQSGHGFKFASHLLGAGIYARDAVAQGVSTTAAKVVTGLVSENIVRQAGNKLFSFFKPANQSKIESASIELHNQYKSG